MDEFLGGAEAGGGQKRQVLRGVKEVQSDLWDG